MENHNDYLYYDMHLFNNKSTPINYEFHDTRVDTILNNLQNFYLSITRFQLNTELLPVFIPKMQNVTDMVYKITVGTSTENVAYISNDTSLVAPLSVTNDFTQEYYYIYSYNHILRMFNETLKTINTNIMPLGTEQITMTLENMFLKINIPAAYAGQDIIFNEELKNLLTLFDYTKTGNDQYKLETQGQPVVTSENTVGYLFSPVNNISFISNSVPVYPTLKSSNNNERLSNRTEAILTDFISASDGLNLYGPNLVYVPSVYRLNNIASNGGLKSLQFKVRWEDVSGNYHDLYLKSGGSATLKIMFQKKENHIINNLRK